MRRYADHNATSPLFGPLVALADDLVGTAFANPSSAHSEGRKAKELLERARAQIGERVVFTASATEANALAIEGHLRASGKRKVVVSAFEHPSVIENAKRFDALIVADLGKLEEALVDAGLCCVMWANNETGAVHDIDAVAAICRRAGVRLHIDAVQGLGKLEERTLPGDTAAISAHKIGALPGVGALLINGLPPAPVLKGGGQQDGLRGGTEPVMQAILFGEAVALWRRDGARFRAAMRSARDAFEAALGALTINARSGPRLPNTSNVLVPGVRGEALLSAMDLDGVAVSHGAACATGALEPSHVLLAMGLSAADARRAIRVSFGPESSAEEGAAVAQILLQAASRLTEMKQ
jgi:cysteine desulfurase